MKAVGLRFNLTLFLATFGGLTVLAAAGFDFLERLTVLVVVVLLYRVALILLDASGRDKG
jgi:hypothetical protein